MFPKLAATRPTLGPHAVDLLCRARRAAERVEDVFPDASFQLCFGPDAGLETDDAGEVQIKVVVEGETGGRLTCHLGWLQTSREMVDEIARAAALALLSPSAREALMTLDAASFDYE